MAASVLIHGLAVADWWLSAWLPAELKTGSVVRNDGHLVVLLRSRDLPDHSIGERRAVSAPRSGAKLKTTELASSNQLLGEKQRVVPEEYLSRERLSLPAEPLTDIRIPWPVGLRIMGVRSAVFTVFIDELGVVRDVVPDGHTLSPVMEEVARDTFFAASFRPASVNGQSVKSIKRIEVVFERLPIQAPQDQDIPEVFSRREL